MEFIQSWNNSVCLTVLIACIFSILVPRSSVGRLMKMMIGVFIFVSFIVPFSDFDWSVFAQEFSPSAGSDSIEEDYYAQNLENIETALQNTVLQALGDAGLAGCTVDVQAVYTDGYVEVSGVQVQVPSGMDAGTVQSVILEKTGINADIIAVGAE